MDDDDKIAKLLKSKEQTDCQKKFQCLSQTINKICKSEFQAKTNLLECREPEVGKKCNFAQQVESQLICTCQLRKLIAKNQDIWNDDILQRLKKEMSAHPPGFFIYKDRTVDFDENTLIILEIPGIKERIKCRYIGKKRPNYIIVLPFNTIIRSKKVLLGTRVKARYINSGQAIGFKSSILASITAPDPMLFLTYPHDIEKVDLRKDKRLPLVLPAKILKPDTELGGIIKDISRNGLLFASKQLVPFEKGFMNIGDEVSISLDFNGLAEGHAINGVVKSRKVKKDEIKLGVQFKNVDHDMQQLIEKLVNHVSEHVE